MGATFWTHTPSHFYSISTALLQGSLSHRLILEVCWSFVAVLQIDCCENFVKVRERENILHYFETREIAASLFFVDKNFQKKRTSCDYIIIYKFCESLI